MYAWTGAIKWEDYNAGLINFNILWVNSNDFKDPDWSVYLVGATANAGSAFQLTATLENDNSSKPSKNALVIGNYRQRTIKNTNGVIYWINGKSGNMTISLPSSLVGMYKKNDWIILQKWTSISKWRIINVSSDLSTLTAAVTKNSATVIGANISVAADESVGLVKSITDANVWVTGWSTEFIPY